MGWEGLYCISNRREKKEKTPLLIFDFDVLLVVSHPLVCPSANKNQTRFDEDVTSS